MRIYQAEYPEEEEIQRAMENPVGSKRLSEIVHSDSTAAIMVDDRTRKTPQKKLLPFVLKELNDAGVHDSQVKLIIATGTHRDMNANEIFERFGQEILDRVEIENHNCNKNLVNKGVTGRGTKILVNKNVLDADIRIAVGASLPHHPAGWSGGAKMFLPDVAGKETVNEMHLLGAREAHREIVSWGMKLNGVEFNEAADITLSSSYPFDHDLTQADKGMFSAARATKPAGEIILLSPCNEGIAPTHEEEMSRLARYDDEALWKMLDDDVQHYINRRIQLDKQIRIGIINNGGEILPIPVQISRP